MCTITENASDCVIIAGTRVSSSSRLQELEKANASTDWKILLATDALHFQDSVQDDADQAAGKARLQVYPHDMKTYYITSHHFACSVVPLKDKLCLQILSWSCLAKGGNVSLT